MLIRSLLLGMLVLVSAGLAAADAPARPSEAMERGRLSLAWDAREAGLCEEVLGYVAEIAPDSTVSSDALWLRADCLSTLGRYAEAAAVLEGPGAERVQDRDRFLEDVYADWAWDCTAREAYGEAASVLGRGLARQPASRWLSALRDATRFRAELQRALAGSRAAGASARLSGGEEASLRRRGDRPAGGGWILAYPWEGESDWVPDATLEHWMPGLAARLDRTARSLWLRVPEAGVRRALESAARSTGLAVKRAGDGWTVRLGDEETVLDADEWSFRAAVEGLGAEGAAASALARARERLDGRRRLLRWVDENRGTLDVSREGAALRVKDPRSRRSHTLDLEAWADSYDPSAAEWTEFWADLTAELARPAGAFRCFCGREAVLRETLLPPGAEESSGALVLERGRGYAVGLTALCPLHQQYVTAELLSAWGVTVRAALERAQGDARAKPWELAFERGAEGGTDYVSLEGEGAAALARHPDLLLGALEAVEGRAVRGTAVAVVAPTASSLVILRDGVSKQREQIAAARALFRGARRGAGGERLGYRARLRLPQSAAGVFEVRPAEPP